MKIWLLMIMAIPLWAVNLLTHNIYERDERVDIMLSFDAPYSGTIKQQNSGQITKIILSNLTIKNKINKEIKSNIDYGLYSATKRGKIEAGKENCHNSHF